MRQLFNQVVQTALIVLFCVTSTFTVVAQKNTYPLTGVVFDIATNEPIPFAVVQVKEANISSICDMSGYFKIKNFPAQPLTLEISSMGYITKEIELSGKKRTKVLVIKMQEASLSVDEVVVTAKRVDSKEGTSSIKIGSDAIKQVQTFSLSDLMSLLPGEKMTPPEMNKTQGVQLRTAAGSSQNSFGTSVVVDGVPLNNDANMQALDPASSTSGYKSTVNSGVDLRDVPTSNIESVEVITGVPSAKYGNVTSGTVIVKRKAGHAPLMVRFNTTPTSYQGGLSRGVNLGRKWGFLNYDADYTYSTSSTTDDSHYFQRMNAGLRWTNNIYPKYNWNNTVSLNMNYSGDGQKDEKDKTNTNKSESTNWGGSLNINGSLELLGRINYSASGSFTKQNTWNEQTEGGPVAQLQVDKVGTYPTAYTPVTYESRKEVEGLPVSFFGRVDAVQTTDAGEFHFDFNTGVEYTYSKNRGSGRVTSGDAVSPNGLPGSRGLDFHEVPASTNLAAYHEFNSIWNHNKWMYKVRLGGRYDYMNERYNLFSPRISSSIKWNKLVGARLAYGVSYKAPSMLTLYPGPIYFDGVNLSHYSNNPSESMAIVTTDIYQPENDHLKPSKGVTTELGFDFNYKGWTAGLTGYIKELTRGVTRNDQLHVMALQQYEVVDNPANQWPVTQAIPNDIVYLNYTFGEYTNNREETTKGLEFTLTPPQIKATKTSFNLSGSYMSTETYTNTPDMRKGDRVSDAIGYRRYGLYQQIGQRYDVCRANLTVIQRIPKLRMVITLMNEFNVYTDRETIGGSLYAMGWYDREGNYYDIPEADRLNEEYLDMKRDEVTYQHDTPPFYSNFHLQIRKELKSGHSFSFFANNVWWYNPTYTSSTTQNEISLNNKISFGFSANFKL